MCVRPIEQDGMTFACRSCDECIATRRHNWVARAMAEKAEWPFCTILALTYSDETEEGRDAAAMFCYPHVRAFLARLRSAVKRAGGSTVRFMCAGEQGDRFGRCHWHIIIYSDLDIMTLGEVKGFRGKVVTDPAAMLSIGRKKKRLNWSMWPWGFVTFQIPDQGGMNYVLSYCLKDQFTGEKSVGTMREAHVENFATGLFRMSKRPAIGQKWLGRKMERLAQQGSVLPKLNLKVPEMGGYWQPNGLFRKKMLWLLVAANRSIVWATGANAPQWSSLLAACGDNQTDLEVLNGKIAEKAKREREAAAQRPVSGCEYWAAISAHKRQDIYNDERFHRLTEEQLDILGAERCCDEAGRWRYRWRDLGSQQNWVAAFDHEKRSAFEQGGTVTEILGLNGSWQQEPDRGDTEE